MDCLHHDWRAPSALLCNVFSHYLTNSCCVRSSNCFRRFYVKIFFYQKLSNAKDNLFSWVAFVTAWSSEEHTTLVTFPFIIFLKMSKTSNKRLLAFTNERDEVVALAQLFLMLIDFTLVSLDNQGIIINFAVGFFAKICKIMNLKKEWFCYLVSVLFRLSFRFFHCSQVNKSESNSLAEDQLTFTFTG